MITINIAKDFTNKPGGRYIKEGPFSGEEFREKILIPKYEKAMENKEKLTVNLDNCYGLATSFLEEAFGGLVRKKGTRDILDILILETEDRPGLIEKITKYIKEA